MATQPPDQEHRLPSREISYAYAVAMYFAQRLELDLRAILSAADYHGWIPEINLSEEEIKRFGNSENFIDSATCGRLIAALQKTEWIKNKQVFSIFERACQHRNRLAHSFLASQNFDRSTKDDEKQIIRELHKFTCDLYGGLVIARALRDRCEVEAEKAHRSLAKMMREFGITSYENLDTHFISKRRQKK